MTDTIDTSPEAVDAATHLLNNQQQLDADGTMVGVSRQALDEVLTGLKLAVKRIAELEAQPEPVVQVKPLEWQGPKPNGGRKRGRWDARGYRVVKHEDDKFVLFKNYTGMGEYETVELALTAAQDDHERRILSALTIRSEQDVRNEALEAVIAYMEKQQIIDGIIEVLATDLADAIRAMKGGGS